MPVDHAVLNQLQSRSVPFTHGCRTAVMFVSNLLRITRQEATARVRAAEVLGQRRTLTGAPVEPRFPLVAAAQADGVLSDRHAAVIIRTIDTLPEKVADRFADFVEQTLVEHGRHLDPARAGPPRPPDRLPPGSGRAPGRGSRTRPAALASTCTAAPTGPRTWRPS